MMANGGHFAVEKFVFLLTRAAANINIMRVL